MKNEFIKKSPWVYIMKCTQCNGCSIEISAALTPKYDLERFGVLVRPTPRQCDIFIVSGFLNKKMKKRILNIIPQLAKPFAVIAVGSCAISGGAFRFSKNFCCAVDEIIDVDVYIHGCPPRPESIIDGVFKALKVLDYKRGCENNE